MKKMLSVMVLSISLICAPILPVNAAEINTDSDNLEIADTFEQEIVDTTNHTYSFHEMEADILALSIRYPELISYQSVGMSVDSRNIWLVTMGNPDAPKAIYVQAGIHGREWMNCWLVMKQLEAMCITYGDYPIWDQICFYIIPMVNPDGITISQFGISAINDVNLRTKLYKMNGASWPRLWKANANGVDLNRNFSVGWGAVVSTASPGALNYNGLAYNTEPEVIAVINAFTSRKFEIAITYHSMEGAVYWNIGQSGDLYDKTQLLASRVSRITGYRLGVQSVVHGLDYNWMIFDQQTPTVLIETGTVACPLPYSQWNELWTRNKDLLIQLAVMYL